MGVVFVGFLFLPDFGLAPRRADLLSLVTVATWW